MVLLILLESTHGTFEILLESTHGIFGTYQWYFRYGTWPTGFW